MQYKDILFEIEEAAKNWNIDDVINLKNDIDKIFSNERWHKWSEEENICMICGTKRIFCGGEEKHG